MAFVIVIAALGGWIVLSFPLGTLLGRALRAAPPRPARSTVRRAATPAVGRARVPAPRTRAV